MSDFDSSATRQIGAMAARVWRWAHDCISALVTDLAASPAAGDDWRAMLLIDSDGARLWARRKGQLVDLGRLEGGTESAMAVVKSNLSRAELQALALRFTEDRAIIQDMALPESARALMGAILRNKIESLAPWPIEESVWGYRVGETGRNGTLPVTVGIIGRKSLAGPLDALASAGLKPLQVDIAAGEGAAPILIDHSSESRRKAVSLAMRAGVGGLAAIFVAIGILGGFLVWRDSRSLAAIEARTEDLKRELTGRAGLQADTGKLAEANRLVENKLSENPMVIVLDELTRIVPDGNWLTAIDFLDGQITIQGRGGAATELVKSLEAADVFSKVNFASATQLDDVSGAESYSIQAAVEPKAVTP